MEISKMTAVCAARHFIAAHESTKLCQIVDFGKVCEGCEFLPECQADWLKTAAPIFEAAQRYPNVFCGAKFVPTCIAGSPLLSRLWRRIRALRRTGKHSRHA